MAKTPVALITHHQRGGRERMCVSVNYRWCTPGAISLNRANKLIAARPAGACGFTFMRARTEQAWERDWEKEREGEREREQGREDRGDCMKGRCHHLKGRQLLVPTETMTWGIQAAEMRFSLQTVMCFKTIPQLLEMAKSFFVKSLGHFLYLFETFSWWKFLFLLCQNIEMWFIFFLKLSNQDFLCLYFCFGSRLFRSKTKN